ncbi:hypothetical protein [Agrobacterium tumefaciens]|uniref:hypothetical protein n=1 Tax=Agrobacterium tumefaciens TaxID=358 RepID=UPI0012D2BF88|nr:hypothetical protein [Agrobacterium tumefaciens]
MTAYRRECNMSGNAAALTFIHLCDSSASGTRAQQTTRPRFSTGCQDTAPAMRIETIIFGLFPQAAEKPREIGVFLDKFTLHLHAAVASICQTCLWIYAKGEP